MSDKLQKIFTSFHRVWAHTISSLFVWFIWYVNTFSLSLHTKHLHPSMVTILFCCVCDFFVAHLLSKFTINLCSTCYWACKLSGFVTRWAFFCKCKTHFKPFEQKHGSFLLNLECNHFHVVCFTASFLLQFWCICNQTIEC